MLIPIAREGFHGLVISSETTGQNEDRDAIGKKGEGGGRGEKARVLDEVTVFP